jgi:hypothetical protein
MPTNIDHDDPNFDWITDRHGRKVRVLRDGGTARVRFRDAQSIRAGRHTLTDAERQQQLASCRPGYRVMADSQQVRERRQWANDSYSSHEHELTNAWRNPPKGLGALDGNGNGGRFGQQREGDQCMINGEVGVLRRRNGRLQCVPLADDDDDNGDFAEFERDGVDQALDDRELANRDYIRSLTSAWKRG